MRKPNALNQLLEELETEIDCSSVATTGSGSKAVVFINDDEFTLNDTEAELLFHSEETIDRFFEALGCPVDSAIELHNLTVTDDVFTALEKRFVSADYT